MTIPHQRPSANMLKKTFGDFIDKSMLIYGFQLRTTSLLCVIHRSFKRIMFTIFITLHCLFKVTHHSQYQEGYQHMLQNTVQHKYFQKRGGNSIQKNLLRRYLNLDENRMVQEIQTMLNYETEKKR